MEPNYKWSETSKRRLHTCKGRLISLFNYVLLTSPVDITVACGYRGEAKQIEAYQKGLSKARWGESLHNKMPSRAVDIYPYANGRMVNGSQEGDMEIIKLLARHVKRCSRDLGIQIKWGGDFKSFSDFPHWELIER